MNILSLKEAIFYLHKKLILSKETVHIYSGDKIALVVRNGCGKSTLLKILAQEIELEEGLYISKPKLTKSPQNPPEVPDCSVEVFIQEVLEAPHRAFQGENLVSSLKLNPKQMLSQLSGGELRWVYIARTLLTLADLNVLDEPTNHLDTSTYGGLGVRILFT